MDCWKSSTDRPQALWKQFFEQQAAPCTGINQWEGSQVPKYVSSTHLSARVGKLNPDWNEDNSDQALDSCFQKAMSLTGSEFQEEVTWISKVWPCSLPFLTNSKYVAA